MGSTNLDNVLKLSLLVVHGIVQLLQSGDEFPRNLHDSRDVHGSGEPRAVAFVSILQTYNYQFSSRYTHVSLED